MATKVSAETTAIDGLRTIYQEIAALTVRADSGPHMQFLSQLMSVIQGYIVGKGAEAQQMPMGGGGPPGGARPQPGGPGGPPQPPNLGPGGAMGAPPSAGNINPDELRRMLGGAAGGQPGAAA